VLCIKYEILYVLVFVISPFLVEFPYIFQSCFCICKSLFAVKKFRRLRNEAICINNCYQCSKTANKLRNEPTPINVLIEKYQDDMDNNFTQEEAGKSRRSLLR